MRQDIAAAVDAIAAEHGFEPAALRAVVEVESSGEPFVTVEGERRPVIRFERHVFLRELPEADRRAARERGLAADYGAPGDPRTVADSWELLDSAVIFCRTRGLSDEPAHRAVSWGLMQVMGFNAELAGHPDAVSLARACASVEGQIRAGVSFIEAAGLAEAVRDRDWRAFARGYNGRDFERWGYHTKLAAAFLRHRGSEAVDPPPRSDMGPLETPALKPPRSLFARILGRLGILS